MVEVKGESQYQDALEKIVGGRPDDDVKIEVVAALIPEPKNRHDENAVQVQIDGKLVGYINADDAEEYSPVLQRMMKRGKVFACRAFIMGGRKRTRNQDPHQFGVFLDVADPDDLED